MIPSPRSGWFTLLTTALWLHWRHWRDLYWAALTCSVIIAACTAAAFGLSANACYEFGRKWHVETRPGWKCEVNLNGTWLPYDAFFAAKAVELNSKGR